MAKTSEIGKRFIARHEGLRLKAYKCPANVWTIGYGHTATAKENMHITPDKAMQLLGKDLAHAEGAVTRSVKRPISQNQFDALVSFVFNVGAGALASSTLLKKINAGADMEAIGKSWLAWNKARVRGVLTPLAGLTKRRQEEFTLYCQS